MGQQSWVDRELGYIVGRAGGSCLPKASPKLPRAFKSLSKSRQRLPKASQSLPKSPQSLPKASQSLPKVSPKTPPTYGLLPRASQRPAEPKSGKERKSNCIKDSGSGRERRLETGAILLFDKTAFAHYRQGKIQKRLKNASKIKFLVGLFFGTCSIRFSVVFEQKGGVPPSTSASEIH